MTQYSTSGCAVVVAAAPQQRLVNVRVAGDLDADAEPALSEVVARVAALTPERVFVDLGEVAFAGSTLAHFLARLVGVLPQAMPVTVCRPGPMHQWVLDAAGMTQILMISSHPAGLALDLEDGSRGRC
ncbi:STAS domain-containing protein [Paractinoplanes rishiriensis]|uniref:STAS domain-containing protein n=1 Tax=Paractinoplanes rishiriensis TaxID=1050105 RepID=UPI001941AD86|nr:STAS domain-containing protein [Actinoplanes rishiriensis]